jgi:hypothetical protein
VADAAGGQRETFPVFFQLAIPSGGISNADLASKLEHFGDTNQFAATLIELARDPSPDAPQRLQAFLGRLENHIGESGEREELEAAMRALFQAADELLRREESGRLDIDICSTCAGSCGGCCCRWSRTSACRCWRRRSAAAARSRPPPTS